MRARATHEMLCINGPGPFLDEMNGPGQTGGLRNPTEALFEKVGFKCSRVGVEFLELGFRTLRWS